MEITNESSGAVHKFEMAGLGKAPFRVVGFDTMKFQACPGAPSQAGGSCDYCAQAIMYVARIESADGKRFKVGCDCVAKTGDAGLVNLIKREEKRRERTVRHAREAEKIAELRQLLSDQSVRERLAGIMVDGGRRERRLLDSADWFLANAGTAGKVKMLKQVRQALAQ